MASCHPGGEDRFEGLIFVYCRRSRVVPECGRPGFIYRNATLTFHSHIRQTLFQVPFRKHAWLKYPCVLAIAWI